MIIIDYSIRNASSRCEMRYKFCSPFFLFFTRFRQFQETFFFFFTKFYPNFFGANFCFANNYVLLEENSTGDYGFDSETGPSYFTTTVRSETDVTVRGNIVCIPMSNRSAVIYAHSCIVCDIDHLHYIWGYCKALRTYFATLSSTLALKTIAIKIFSVVWVVREVTMNKMNRTCQ